MLALRVSGLHIHSNFITITTSFIETEQLSKTSLIFIAVCKYSEKMPLTKGRQEHPEFCVDTVFPPAARQAIIKSEFVVIICYINASLYKIFEITLRR